MSLVSIALYRKLEALAGLRTFVYLAEPTNSKVDPRCKVILPSNYASHDAEYKKLVKVSHWCLLVSPPRAKC